MSGIEAVFTQAGFGLYDKFLISFAAACYFSSGLASMSLHLYLPLITCDIAMDERMALMLHLALSVGIALGGFLLTAIADIVGRKAMITLSMVLIFIGILTSSFAFNVVGIIMSQITVGAGLILNYNIVKIHLAESLPMFRRGMYIVLIDAFWTLGCLVAVAALVVMMPVISKYKNHYARIFTWRLLYGFSGFFTILLACISALVLESPRYLIYEKRMSEALSVFRQIFAMNTSKIYTHFKVEEMNLYGLVMDLRINQRRDLPNHCNLKRFVVVVTRLVKSIQALMGRKFFGSVFLVAVMRILMCYGHFRLTMLSAKLLEGDQNMTHGGLKLLHFEDIDSINCKKPMMNLGIYAHFAMLSSLSILGQILVMTLIAYLERKFLIVSGLFLAGVFATILALVQGIYEFRIAIAALLLIAYNVAESTLGLVAIEMFPTGVRGAALGETRILSKVANVILDMYATFSTPWILVLVAISFEVGAAIAFAFPSFKNRPMVD